MMSFLAAATVGLLLPHVAPPRTSSVRMELVEEFAVSRVIKDVRVFDSDFAEEIRAAVKEVGEAALEEKGSFSLAVPGGSVVAALGGFDKGDLDFSKTHIFFCNEKLPSAPCLAGALEQVLKLGVPEENVHGVGEGSAAEVAAQYTELLKSHSSIDNSGAVPSVRTMQLAAGAGAAHPHPHPHPSHPHPR